MRQRAWTCRFVFQDDGGRTHIAEADYVTWAIYDVNARPGVIGQVGRSHIVRMENITRRDEGEEEFGGSCYIVDGQVFETH